ncbi:hypothetical protein LCM17_23455 [Cereibacter sphaeroides]|nr:hypothetical protein [Cereibacter sphaeroides]
MPSIMLGNPWFDEAERQLRFRVLVARGVAVCAIDEKNLLEYLGALDVQAKSPAERYLKTFDDYRDIILLRTFSNLPEDMDPKASQPVLVLERHHFEQNLTKPLPAKPRRRPNSPGRAH